MSEWFHSFRTKNRLESRKKVCEIINVFNIVMPSEGTKILTFNKYQETDRELFIIYADLECVIGKIDGCKNDPEKSSGTKVGRHIP